MDSNETRALAAGRQTTDWTEDWVTGWAVARGRSVERNGDAWGVEVGDAYRDREYVIGSPSVAEATRLVRLLTGPRDWLTVLGERDPAVDRALAPLQAMSRVETLMEIRDLAASPRKNTHHRGHGVQDGQLGLGEENGVAEVTITIDEVVAACGYAVVSGEALILDRISTEPQYQRRGLGRRVVEALCEWGSATGAERGLLVASVEGRALYLTLGWRDVMPVAGYTRAAA
ncbi:GNAT family N-acetyltransferase [Leucobacter sp. NPDC058333]|uniref:GNAT family N-acetyltransferase n=1 Tax=Leucobacter sp. NPDC058333 TaxID=3346450 RepID=UPI003664ADDC